MALGELLGLRQQKTSGPFEILEGEEFEQDLRKRRGGLRSDRQEDRIQIEELKQSIAQGALTEEQIQAKIHRNPGAATELISASQTPERQIGQQFFSPGRPEERRGPLVEGAPGPEAEGPVQVIPGEDPKADIQGAVLEAMSRGRFDLAKKILSAASPQSGSKARSFKDTVVGEEGEEFTRIISPEGETKLFPTGTNKFNKDAIQIGKNLSKAKIPQIIGPLKVVSKQINEFSKTGQLKGVGGLKNIPATRLLSSKEGRVIQSAVNRLNEIDLRVLTGAAAPEFEFRRTRAMNGLSAVDSAEDYVNTFRELILPLWQDIIKNSLSGFDERAVELWRKRTPQSKDIEAIGSGKLFGQSSKPKTETQNQMFDFSELPE